ncbi:MAG: BatD family protein [Nitrospiria bacterium]
MVSLKNRLMWMLLVVMTVPGVRHAGAAEIRAELDRSRVSLNESFTLVFWTDEDVDGEPDFSPIERHFEIIQKSEGSRMEIINARITQKKEWTLTLMGKQAGFFTIPSISFGKDQSPAVRIDIEKNPASPKNGAPELLFLDVSAEPSSGYVQSQFIYTIRFYRAVSLLSAQISEPDVSDADAVVEKLGEDRQFETTLHGERYRVVERKYAIFPQQSGRLTVAPISFSGQLAGRGRSQFNPFPGGGPIKRLRSEKMTLDVLPVPQDKIKGRWLPARDLKLMENWTDLSDDGVTGKVGEPLTWTLQLVAEGLTAAQLPEINPDIPSDFKAYPDQPAMENETREDGLVGIRQEKIALIPTQPGTLLLPAVEVPWWNTRTKTVEIARLPARRIQVAPAEISQIPAAPLPAPKTLENESPMVNAAPPSAPQSAPGMWPWVSLALAIAWGTTLAAWWRAHRKTRMTAPDVKQRETPPDTGPIKNQLKKSCLQNDAAAAKEALLAWGRARWPGRPLSLGEIATRVIPALSSEIKTLNAVLYSPSATSWEAGAALWAAFEAETAHQQKPAPKPSALAPLYP